MEPNGQMLKWAQPALVIAVLVLAGTIAYGSFRDKTPPVPVASATPGTGPDIDALRQATRATPDDPAAWARLGMAHFDREEYPQAIAALEQATRLAPARANLWSLLGEARVHASARDPMPAAALDAFRKALAIDPKDPPGRYFLAVKRDLDGDHKGAIEDWLKLLADTPPGAPWEPSLRRTIEQVGKINHIDVTTRMAAMPSPATALPGPNAEQIEQAKRIAPGDQDAMARGMVASLEAKLKTNPANVPGWIMLMRSWMTLGDPAKAAAALRDGIAANPGARAQLESEARSLGVPR